jgi:glycopeptide antibiotics resistance protein
LTLGWRRFWGVVSLVIAAWLLWMTLRPMQSVASDLMGLTSSAAGQVLPTYVLIDLLGNVAVFVPFGATLALAVGEKSARRAVGLAALVGAGLSLAIELLQTGLYSRVSQPLDWFLNTLGTTLGAALVVLVLGWLSRRSAASEE